MCPHRLNDCSRCKKCCESLTNQALKVILSVGLVIFCLRLADSMNPNSLVELSKGAEKSRKIFSDLTNELARASIIVTESLNSVTSRVNEVNRKIDVSIEKLNKLNSKISDSEKKQGG